MVRNTGEIGLIRRASLGMTLVLGGFTTSACGEFLEDDAPRLSSDASGLEVNCTALDSPEVMTDAERIDYEIQSEIRDEFCDRIQDFVHMYQDRENPDIDNYRSTSTGGDSVELKYRHVPTNTHFSATFAADENGGPNLEHPRAILASRVTHGSNENGQFTGTDKYLLVYNEDTGRFGLEDTRIIDDSLGVTIPEEGLTVFNSDPSSVSLEWLGALRADVQDVLQHRSTEVSVAGTM